MSYTVFKAIAISVLDYLFKSVTLINSLGKIVSSSTAKDKFTFSLKENLVLPRADMIYPL